MVGGEGPSVRDLVIRLLDEAQMTPQAISEAMDNRVSSRTIYRWVKGESLPQNSSDHQALVQLVQEKCA